MLLYWSARLMLGMVTHEIAIRAAVLWFWAVSSARVSF